MIIPLTEPLEGASVDFTFLAASGLLFTQLHEVLQQRMTNGQYLQYSEGVTVNIAAKAAAHKQMSIPYTV